MTGRLVPLTWRSDTSRQPSDAQSQDYRYDAFLPDKLIGASFSMDAEVALLAFDAENAIATLNEDSRQGADSLAGLLIRAEAIASSKIAGVAITARELALAEAGAESSAAIDQVRAGADALGVAVAEAASDQPFDAALLLRIHRRLTGTVPDERGGTLRTRQTWVGGKSGDPREADFVPPPPEELEILLADLCEAINHDLLPALIQTALVHAQFETIRPFDDGNGRVGRALIHIVLRRRKRTPYFVAPISVAMAGTTSRYIEGLTSFRRDDPGTWVTYFAEMAATAANKARTLLNSVAALKSEWMERVSVTPHAADGSAEARSVVDILPAHPIIGTSVAAAATGLSQSSVQEAIEQLHAAGVLLSVTGRGSDQFWEAAGLLDVIERLHTGAT